MKFIRSCCLGLAVSGWLPKLGFADSKPKENYAVRPSSQTVNRREAALALGKTSAAPDAGPKLMKALDDKDAMTRVLALQSLGSLRYKAAGSKVSDLLISDPSVDVRQAAATTLRQIGDPAAVDALVKALKDPAVNVRVTALMQLAYYRIPKTRLPVEAVCTDPAPEVRRTALYVLSRLEDPASVPVVQGLLKDPDIAVRAGAARTLGELRVVDSAAALKPLLNDSDKGVQASAARSLLMMNDSAGFETAKRLANDSDLTVRLIAIDALGWSKDPAAEAQLQSLLTKTPDNSRVAVQESLARTKQLRKK